MSVAAWATRWLSVLCAIVALALPVSPAVAADEGPRRLVQMFDFEERDKGNYEDLPMGWQAIGRPARTVDANFPRTPLHAELTTRPGFPSFCAVRFDKPQRDAGNHCLYLELNGGSAGAFLEVGAIPAVPRSDYVVTARVRTARLRRARAQLVAYFVDHRGRRIAASVVSSPPIQTDGRWDPLSVHLAGDFEDAAWIGIEVELLQPTGQADAPLGKHQVVYEDVRGAAWFDDVGVWQLPSLQVRTQSPVNIIRAPAAPQLSMQVRDLSGRRMLAEAVVYDHRLQPVARATQPVGDGAPGQWRWRPPLERFGWYLVDLRIRSDESAQDEHGPLAREISAFLWLPDEPLMNLDDAPRFGVMAQDLPQEQLPLLPALLDGARLSAVTLSAWSPQVTRISIDERLAGLDDVLQKLMGRGTEVTLSLSPMPAELARLTDLDPDTPLGVFAHSGDIWRPYLAPVLLRLGQRVRRWQLGSPDVCDAFDLPRAGAMLHDAEEELRNLTPQPRVVLPWRATMSRRPDITTVDQYLLDVPQAVQPEHIAAFLAPWQESSATPVTLHLRPASALALTHERRIDDLALRMLHGWQSGAWGVSLPRPWTTGSNRHMTLVPDPLLGTFTGVAHRLAGRRVLGRLPLDEGLECFILDGSAGGALAVWNRSASPEEAVLDMFLGSQPQAVDVWGNRQTLSLIDNRHRCTLGTTPLFIEGIDPELAQFRAGFTIDPPFIESQQVQHRRIIRVTNPWPRTISGHLTITEPGHWSIEPRRTQFSIAAGQTSEIPVMVSFPVSEVAGRKRLTARFDFVATQRYVLDVSAPMELGLKDIEFQATVALERNAQTSDTDAVVTQLVTNRGSKTLALYAFASMPGHPRQERIISQLQPGQSILRRFRFPGAGLPQEVPGELPGEQVKQPSIRVGLRETAGPAMLNKVLTP